MSKKLYKLFSKWYKPVEHVDIEGRVHTMNRSSKLSPKFGKLNVNIWRTDNYY